MSDQPRSLRVRPDIKSKWQECRAVVNNVAAARILWKLRWSDIERGLFGGDFKRAYDKYRTMGMWRHVHGGSMERAVIELGKTLGAITTGEYNWLLHGLDESADPEQAKVDSAVNDGRPRAGGSVSVGVLELPVDRSCLVSILKTLGLPLAAR